MNTFQSTLILCIAAYAHAFSPSLLYPTSNGIRYYSKQLSAKSPSHQEFFDAEEAAAIDASDSPDAGVEGAMMERAVFVAYDMTKPSKKSKFEPTEEEILKAFKNYASIADFDTAVHFQKEYMYLNESDDDSVLQGHLNVRRLANIIEFADK